MPGQHDRAPPINRTKELRGHAIRLREKIKREQLQAEIVQRFGQIDRRGIKAQSWVQTDGGIW